MSENLEEFQEGLLWKMADGEALLVGVTQNGLDLAGAIQAIDIADIGDEFEAGDWIGEIRGKNSVVELVAPFALKISERNEELLEQPGLIEDDPTGDAWVVRVEKMDG